MAEDETKCGQCKSRVFDSQKAVQCDGNCNLWFHIVCSHVTDAEYRDLSRDKSRKWYCKGCRPKHEGDDGDGGDDVDTVDRILQKLETLKPLDQVNSSTSSLGKRRGRPRVGWSSTSWLYRLKKTALRRFLKDADVQFNESDSVVKLRQLACTLSKRNINSANCEEADKNSSQYFEDVAQCSKTNLGKSKTNLQIWRKKIKPDAASWKVFHKKQAINKSLKKILINKEEGTNKCVWKCPMCCNRFFNNHNSLIRHLGKFVNRVYCSGCSKYVGSVEKLISHLQSECVVANATSRAPLLNNSTYRPAAVEEPSLNSKALQSKVEDKPSLRKQRSFASKSSAANHNNLCRETASHAISVSASSSADPLPDISKEQEKQLTVPVKQKKTRSYFNCSVCRLNFSSVEEHVKQYHSEQEVIVNRLDSTEVYHPESVRKRRRGANGSMVRVASPGSACTSPTKQDCVKNTRSSTGVKTVKNEANEEYQQQHQNLLNDLSSGCGSKKDKILKVALTRLADKELRSWIRTSFEDDGQSTEETNINNISVLFDRVGSAASGNNEHKISLDVTNENLITDTVESNVSNEFESNKKQICVPEKVKNSDRFASSHKRHLRESEVRSLRNGVAKECNFAGRNRAVAPKNSNSVNNDSIQHLDGSTNSVMCRASRSVVTINKQNPVLESSPVTVQHSVNKLGSNITKGRNFKSALGRNAVISVSTPLSNGKETSTQSSLPSFAELVGAIKQSGAVNPSGESDSKGTLCLTYNDNCLPVSERSFSNPQEMNPDITLTSVVNTNKICSEERSKFHSNENVLKHKTLMCECVKNKVTNLIINKVLDESGKVLQNLYVCLKCGMGFLMYLLYSKHICDKSNFVCSCPEKDLKALTKRNYGINISEPRVNDVTLGTETGDEAGAWRKMVAVTTSKTLVCSVCSNMFVSDDLSFPDNLTGVLRHDNMPETADDMTANYTCRICSIVTEKRRGRVLVSKVTDKSKEAVEIVVIDPNEDCNPDT